MNHREPTNSFASRASDSQSAVEVGGGQDPVGVGRAAR
jgi:hypothetical protein